VIITDQEFWDLKHLLDVYAGKDHSAEGVVVTALHRILEVHEEMIWQHVKRVIEEEE
jgi:hypothetical protein